MLLYRELAAWFHLLTDPADYAPEAALILRLVREEAASEPRSLLELGSGGGNNASHLKRDLQLTLLDRSAEMLEVSRRLNPECEHVLGDMREARLGRSFDAVLVHDAVSHVTREDDLAATLETLAAHCRPGGAMVACPDFTAECFAPGTKTGGHDGPDGRALRYLEWTWDPDEADTEYLSALSYQLREADGRLRFESEAWSMGLFGRATWHRLLDEAGFEARRVEDEWGRDVFVGRRRD